MSEQVRGRTLSFRGWAPVSPNAWLDSADGRTAGWRAFAIVMIAAVFMALTAPFGTSAEPLPERLGFWVLGAAGGFVLLGKLSGRLALVLPNLKGSSGRRGSRGIEAAALVLIVTPPAAVVSSIIAAWLHHRAIDWALCLRTMPQIALVGAGFAALGMLADRRSRPGRTQLDLGDATLGGLLPPRLAGARLIAMEAQDHYVRLHTDRGAALASTGFEAALAKAETMEGERTHRSWWVARGAVVEVRRGQGRATLQLVGGVAAPVSRRYAKALRSAGWY